MTISARDAVQASQRGLGKIADPAVAAAYAGAQPGVPLLVTRLDQPNRDYYLVPWQDQRGVLLVALVDAASGEMASAAAFATPMRQLVMSPSEARRLVETQLNTRVRGDPKLVWQPARESASPLQPLYRVSVDGGEAFVAADGAVHRTLTPFGKGG